LWRLGPVFFFPPPPPPPTPENQAGIQRSRGGSLPSESSWSVSWLDNSTRRRNGVVIACAMSLQRATWLTGREVTQRQLRSSRDSACRARRNHRLSTSFHRLDAQRRCPDHTVDRGAPKSPDAVDDDFFDIDALSVAVPYCDVVVTERHAHRILTASGLPDRVGTTVLTTLEELIGQLGSMKTIAADE
jgi:hypothetical protein